MKLNCRDSAEAVRVEFDPTVISLEQMLSKILKEVNMFGKSYGTQVGIMEHSIRYLDIIFVEVAYFKNLFTVFNTCNMCVLLGSISCY